MRKIIIGLLTFLSLIQISPVLAQTQPAVPTPPPTTEKIEIFSKKWLQDKTMLFYKELLGETLQKDISLPPGKRLILLEKDKVNHFVLGSMSIVRDTYSVDLEEPVTIWTVEMSLEFPQEIIGYSGLREQESATRPADLVVDDLIKKVASDGKKAIELWQKNLPPMARTITPPISPSQNPSKPKTQA